MIEEARKVETKETFKAFMNDTKSNETLIIILKAHLYIERQLILALTETIIDNKILGGTTFRQKLDLAHSMGIIDDLYGVLGKVNSVRNSYAHDMDYSFDEKEFGDLLSTLSKDDKDVYLAEFDEMKNTFYDGTISEFNFKLQILLSDIWFALVGSRYFAKRAIELRLKEKEIETMTKYAPKEEYDD